MIDDCCGDMVRTVVAWVVVVSKRVVITCEGFGSVVRLVRAW